MMSKRCGVFAFAVLCALLALISGGSIWGTEVPEKFNGIPLYPDSTIRQAMDMTNHAMLMIAVKAQVDDIAEFYMKTMKEKGWTTAFRAEQKGAKLMQFQKDKLLLQVVIQQENDKESATYDLIMDFRQ